ncbi:MAG TPA: M56 family metallopeptidase [Pirellulales bacterium]|nr:M56 family metallopeptidase [Pirellulales bacterium]
MNDLGVSLFWLAVQATVYLLAGIVVYAIVRRFGPAPGASAAASTLVVLACVSAAALSPWPHWWTVSNAKAPAPADSPAVAQAAEAVAVTEAGPAVRNAPLKTNSLPAAIVWGDYWRAFRAELQTARAADTADRPRRQWPTIIGLLLVAGASLALVRFAIGLAALWRYRRALRGIDDPQLREMAESLAQGMGCRRPVELKQSASLTTPATMGWRRPVIVLPGDWRTWTDQERRVVLAHEIAHIARGDYLAWLLSQVSMALHIYHPLVHWLAGRLRLEQELAADAWAAEMSGGREAYLFTLAQMALRQDDRRVAWAARPFLPGRGTLLRRIEMLSHTKPLRNVPLSRRRAVVLAVVAAAFGLIVAGVRAPLGDATRVAHAAPPLQAGPTSGAGGAITLEYVPPRAVAVLAVRPADLLSKAEMQGLVKMLNETIPLAKAGFKIENVEEAKFIVTRFPNPQPGRHIPVGEYSLQVFRYKGPFDWKGKVAEHMVGKTVEASIAGKTYYHSDQGDQAVRPAFYTPDDRTIVIGPEIDLQRAIASAGKSKIDWAANWEKVATGQAAAMVDLAAFSRAMANEPQPEMRAPFAPVWEKGQQLFASLQARDALSLAAQILCATPDDAGRVKATLEAALTLARNMLDEADRNLTKAPAAQAAALIPLIDMATEAIKQGKLETDGSTVQYSTRLDVDVAETVAGVLTPAVFSARQAAQRSQAANNLKQLMLALHNYQNVNKHFPPPVVIGPDGKTPHSWRVEILPYVEAQHLYQRYKMEEPWDSENNKKVLDEMPAVFRDPAADAASKDTAYFALVGPTTGLGPQDGKGTQFAEITDGMSNTIALVEAKRAVPWTKPEDIEYDPSKPMPKFGGRQSGGFLAAFCDGSVQFLSDTINEQVLRAMITKAGGELVTWP